MSRLAIPTRDDAPGACREALDAVHGEFGVVPNLFRLIAISPAALSGYRALSGALEQALDLKTRERIALATAQVNGCDYGLSAHSHRALNVARLTPEEIARNRQGRSADPQADAAVRFAAQVARTRGHVGDAEIEAVRAAGFGDAAIVEIVALVAENMFANFLSEVARAEIDFPIVRSAEPA